MRWKRRSTWKGLAAGLAGGLVASWAMNLFQAGWSRVQQSQNEKSRRHKATRGPQDEDATVKAARAISEGIFGHELTAKEKKAAGPAVGTAVGGLDGAAAEHKPRIAAATGLPFGAAFWLTADEIGELRPQAFAARTAAERF